MPGTFVYAAATNTVTVTGGTSGSPADFASFVAADRAGTGTSLLAAWSPNSNTKALTYQVRPVELLALLISFAVASKTAEADYIFITGTDWLGAAQTESINVSAGNGTYVSAKRFKTITNIDCSDNAAGGGTVWANGTVAVAQPIWGVIWNKGNRQYQLDAYVYIGDGSTSTYFLTKQEQITISAGWIPNGARVIRANANATFVSGELVNLAVKSTRNGSSFFNAEASNYCQMFDSTGGVLYFYSTNCGSLAENRIYNIARVWNCHFNGGCLPRYSNTTPDIYNLTTTTANCMFQADNAMTPTFNKFMGNSSFYILFILSSGGLIARNVDASMATASYGFRTAGAVTQDIVLIDSLLCTWGVYDTSSGHTKDILRQQSVNLHLADIAGVNVSGATVTLKDKDGTQIFSIPTGADGKIAEQLVTYIKYDHAASWAADTRTPHTLTIAKTGYQNYTDVITIDRKMDLEVALLALGGGVSPTTLGLVPLGTKQVAI
jgi:hypothetical protein